MISLRSLVLYLGGDEPAGPAPSGNRGIWHFNPLLGRLGKPPTIQGPQVYLVNVADDIAMLDNRASSLRKLALEGSDLFDQFGKLLSNRTTDSLNVSDAASFARAINALYSDNVAVEDGWIKQVGKVVGDSSLSLDAFNKSVNKVITDNESITDNAYRQIRKILGDLVSAADGSANTLSKSVADNIQIVDALQRVLSKSILEQVGIVDAMLKTLAKSLSERVDVLDGVARVLGKPIGDNVGVSDAPVKGLFKVVADQVESRDSFTKILAKLFGESSGVTDTEASTLAKSLAERIDVVDTLIAFKQAVRRISDVIDVIDGIRKDQLMSVGESQAGVDGIRKELSKRLSDQVDLFESFAAFKQAVRMLADSVGVSDVTTKTLSKAVGDLGILTDNRVGSLFKSIGDVQLIVDSVAINKITSTLLLAISDILDMSDDSRKAMFKSVGDISGVSDSPSSLLNKSLADRQIVSDAAMSVRSLFRMVTDDLQLSDTFSKSLSKLLADNIDLRDNFVKALTKVLADNESARDLFASQFSKAIGENQAARDLTMFALGKTIAESQLITDTTQLSRKLHRLLTDEVLLSDAASTTKITTQLILDVIETQDVSDAFFKTLIKTVADNQSTDELVLLQLILATPIIRQFIDSMLAGSGDSQESLSGAKAGIRMIADDDDLFDRQHSGKGRRQK